MPRVIKKLVIENMKIKDEDGIRTYSLIADGIKLQVQVPESDILSHKHSEVQEAVNNMFLNSLRHLKHTGKLPKNPDPKELNKWSTTDTGLAIKPKADMIKEFTRFI